MQFNDGSQLRLEPSGDTPIAFTDTDHTTSRYCSQSLLLFHVISQLTHPQVWILEQATRDSPTQAGQSANNNCNTRTK